MVQCVLSRGERLADATGSRFLEMTMSRNEINAAKIDAENPAGVADAKRRAEKMAAELETKRGQIMTVTRKVDRFVVVDMDDVELGQVRIA